MRLINRKYRPWKQILDLSALLFRRPERIAVADQWFCGHGVQLVASFVVQFRS
jgi:hypothetical protein